MLKWIAVAVGGMVLGWVAAIVFVHVAGPQRTPAMERTQPADERAASRTATPVRSFDSDLSGRARVIDGDTIDLGTARIRLFGVDAPESAQSCLAGGRRWPCGREATRALARRIGSRAVTCEARDRDRYGRIVAVCRVGGEDVNAWIAAQGWAFAYRTYSMRYVAEEAEARAARRGIWRGDIVAPWDWRRGERLGGGRTAARPAAQQGMGRCAIKGNISNSGTRIYHVPGGRFYDRTRIDTARGERWFCTEGEARASGWRRSRQ